jgi:hypothetical protein
MKPAKDTKLADLMYWCSGEPSDFPPSFPEPGPQRVTSTLRVRFVEDSAMTPVWAWG